MLLKRRSPLGFESWICNFNSLLLEVRSRLVFCFPPVVKWASSSKIKTSSLKRCRLCSSRCWKNLKTLKMRWDGIKGGTRWKGRNCSEILYCSKAIPAGSRPTPSVSHLLDGCFAFSLLHHAWSDTGVFVSHVITLLMRKGSEGSHPALKKVLLCLDAVSQHQAALEWTVWYCLQSAGHGWWCAMGPFITRDQITEAQSLWSCVCSGGKKVVCCGWRVQQSWFLYGAEAHVICEH